ncbi:MAG: mannitol dehydrogenase family protein [Mycobacteriales bacterium]
MTRALTRTAAGASAPWPVRTVHLGLGNFFRAHQAWYSNGSGEAPGIAAFTGRRPDAARALTAQEGVYSLIVRDGGGDHVQRIDSISAAIDGADVPALQGFLCDPNVVAVTLTITEAGYRRGANGIDANDPAIADDIATLRAGGTDVRTAPARLVSGLLARRRADAGPIAVVPCDNLTGNGAATASVIISLAELIDADAAAWMDESVSFVSTMVDRITPHTTDDDIATVRALTGFDDAAPVVTEPFTEWVLADRFPAGRPAWDRAGARFVADVAPFELRKLWLLNGAHSTLAYAGLGRGIATVADAVADTECGALMNDWWDAAASHLPLPAGEITAYREALTQRFENPRMRHQLTQIAGDGSQKLPERVVPVLRLERSAGRLPHSAAAALAGWVRYLRAGSVNDPQAHELRSLAGRPDADAVPRLLGFLANDLADDHELVQSVRTALV